METRNRMERGVRTRKMPGRGRLGFLASAWMAVACTCLALSPNPAAGHDLTPEQEARIRTVLPYSADALLAGRDYHIVSIGDSIVRYRSYDENKDNTHKSFHGVFARMLSEELFYAGGVRDVNPKKGQPAKAIDFAGKEITIENLGMSGRVALHGLGRMTTDAFDLKPNLIIFNFGINDAIIGLVPELYGRAIERVILLCKEKKVDLILLSPTVMLREPASFNLVLTRSYAGVMRDVAAKHKVPFFDLGQMSSVTRGVEGERDAERAFNNYIHNLGKKFDHGPGIDDKIHPSEKTHDLLGKLMAGWAIRGEPDVSYVTTARAQIKDDGIIDVEITVTNLSKINKKGFFYALPAGRVTNPLDQTKQETVSYLAFPLEISPGEKQKFLVRYQSPKPPKTLPAFRADLPVGDGPLLRLPIVIVDNEEGRIHDADVWQVTPFYPRWSVGLADNQKGKFTVKCALINPGTSPQSGSWSASWNNRNIEGSFQVAGKGTQVLEMTFPLPVATGYTALKSELVAKFVSKSGTVVSKREVEATRNFSLSEKIELLKIDSYSANKPGDPGSDPAGRSVLMRADADQKGLYLTYDCKNIEFAQGSDPKVASATIDLFIDARPRGERRKFGFSEAITIFVPYLDGPCTLKDWKAGQLGEGYDRPLDWKYVKASSATRGGGDRRISVFIPRSFFYRHEWNLGSNDSILGLETSVAILKVTALKPKGFFANDMRFRINQPGMHPCNTDAMPVLELAPEASGRWSIRIY